MTYAGRTEVRFEVPSTELAVLDGFCSATGQDRTTVVRKVLREWSHRKHREARMIVRVAGDKPVQPESDLDSAG